MSAGVTLPLVAGEKLTRDEFMRRWEAMPELKRAELIEGVVYMSSPISRIHWLPEGLVHAWLSQYAIRTPGCEFGSAGTWLMLGDAPQPDSHLSILPEYGGQSSVEGIYAAGAPELIVEVTLSSRSHDLGPKLRLYEKAGVLEYISVLLERPQVIWRRLVSGRYVNLAPGDDGILRSQVFPGLWLDPAALLALNGARVVELLGQGLQSPEHEEFVRALAARGPKSPPPA